MCSSSSGDRGARGSSRRLDTLEDSSYDVVYVSPHLDDVTFGCAAHIRSQQQLGKRTLVVTIFTRGSDDARNPFSIYEPRYEEDRLSMQELSTDYYHSGFSELIFRSGLASKTCCLQLRIATSWVYRASFLAPGADYRLADDVYQHLLDIKAWTGCKWMLGPIGVGFHPDHLLVNRSFQKLKSRAPADLRISLYHDWGYSCYRILRYSRLPPFGRSLRGLRTTELAIQGEAMPLKVRASAAYSGQVKELFGTVHTLQKWLSADPYERFVEFLPGEPE